MRDNVVRGNLVRRSRVDGIVVVQKDRHSLLTGNVVIRVGRRRLRRRQPHNDADRQPGGRNDDLGIEAVFGVIDGGGNIARNNGNPRQCMNIFCS